MSEHPPQTQTETPNPADNFEDIRDLVEVGSDTNGDGVNTLHRPDDSGKLLSVDELEMIREHQDLIRGESQEKSDDGREIDPIRAEKIAHYIHKHSEGNGISPGLVDKLYALIEDGKSPVEGVGPSSPEGDPNTPEGSDGSASSPESSPDDASQESAAEKAREEIENVFEGDDNPTTEADQVEIDVENIPDVEPVLNAEELAIYEQIDAIDGMHNYTDRIKKLKEFALKNNGNIDSLGRDIGIEVAKRIESSQVRSGFNPRRYLLKLGSARRHYNSLLADMAKAGPNGANLAAANAMKRNWDPRYRNIVDGKNKVIYETSKIYERQIKDLPVEIEKISGERDALINRDPSNKDISEKQKSLGSAQEIQQDLSEQIAGIQNAMNDDANYKDLEKSEIDAKKEQYASKIKDVQDKYNKIDEAINDLTEELSEAMRLQRAADMKDAQKKEKEIAEKTSVYTHSVEASSQVDSSIDNTFLHAHKYRGEIKANRAVVRDDLGIVEELNNFGNKRKRQQAISKLIQQRANNNTNEQGEPLTEEEISDKKASLVLLAKKEIKNRKIFDQTVKSLS